MQYFGGKSEPGKRPGRHFKPQQPLIESSTTRLIHNFHETGAGGTSHAKDVQPTVNASDKALWILPRANRLYLQLNPSHGRETMRSMQSRLMILSIAAMIFLVQQAAANCKVQTEEIFSANRMRRLDQGNEVEAQCSAIVSKSTLTYVSYVIEDECTASSTTVCGCVAGTSCQICFEHKNDQNSFLMQCQYLRDMQLKKQQEKIVTAAMSTEAQTTQAESPEKSSSKSAEGSSEAQTASSMYLPAVQAIVGLAAAVVVLICGVFAIKRYRERMDAEDALSTPRDSTVLVAVQSRTQIATL